LRLLAAISEALNYDTFLKGRSTFFRFFDLLLPFGACISFSAEPQIMTCFFKTRQPLRFLPSSSRSPIPRDAWRQSVVSIAFDYDWFFEPPSTSFGIFFSTHPMSAEASILAPPLSRRFSRAHEYMPFSVPGNIFRSVSHPKPRTPC